MSRRYCYPQCRDPWFQECADCWQSGGNFALTGCGPLCGAAKAYGQHVKPWQCPVRVAYEAAKVRA